MRILFVSKSEFPEDTIRNNLRQLSEKDSIKFVYSYNEAENFIDNHIIKDQVPIDLVITEDNIEMRSASEFKDRIQRDKKRTFSHRDFYFASVPVILIADKYVNKNAYSGFTDVIDDVGLDKLHWFAPEIISGVRSWRKQVLDELDNLGIRKNSGSIDFQYYLSVDRKRDIATYVLSDNFKMFPRQLNYDWIFFNEKEIEKALDEYIKELKKADRLNKKREEKKFHRLFNKYSFLLRRDNYQHQWYEPRLYYNEYNYYEPDYALKPNFNHKTDLSILEVKLPNEKFISKSKFHPKPYKKILDHIFQVNDYKDYLESDQYQEIIRKAFGFIPTRLEYNILVGRLSDKTSGFSVLNSRMRQMNAIHINFITYDELLNYQVEFLERMKMLKVT